MQGNIEAKYLGKEDMDFHSSERMNNQNQLPLPLSRQPQQKGTTFVRTCFNGLNALSGFGVLSVPYALSEGGWLSLIILLSLAVVGYYTGLLLHRCMATDKLIRTYADIGQLAFGRKGRLTTSTFTCLELYITAVTFLILEGDNLHKLFPDACLHLGGKKLGGEQVFVILTALIVLPTTWLKSLGLLAYVSCWGVLASFVLFGSVFWVGAIDDVGFHEKGSLWRWNGLPTTISLYTFCYGGHSIFPALSNSMKDRSQFPKVLLVCFALSTLIYGSMAVLGYVMFGEHLASQVTLNLPISKISSKIGIYTTLMIPITKYAIIVVPITTAIEEISPCGNSRLKSILIRSSLVISNVVVALSIPFFGYVMAFAGAFLCTSVSMLFPCLCYLKIKKAYRKLGIELIFICIILTLGIFVSVIGTYVSLRNIIQHVKPQ